MSQTELVRVKFNNEGDGEVNIGLTSEDWLENSSQDVDDSSGSSSVENMQEEIGQIKYYDGRCGIFKWTPNWLQIFNNPKVLVLSLGYFLIFQGSIATGFISVGISSIEKRYNLSSSLSAFAAVSYEIGVIIFILFTSYFGGRSHKPRVLGVSLLVMGIGSFIFASPHYFSGAYYFNVTSTEVCTNASEFAPSCTIPHLYFYPLFLIGNIIIGCGSSTLYTVGTGLVDDSTHPRYSPIYLSVVNIVAVAGPCVGFGLGGVFLSIFVNPFTPTTLTSADPQWVGAWWIGFVLTGIFSIVGSIQFFFYPRRLKGSREYDKLRKQQQPVQDQGLSFEEDHNVSVLTMIKEYPHYAYRILKNPTFLFVTLGIAAGAFIVSGTITFLPKYLEVQFSISSSLASYIIGAVTIPAASIGLLLGGITLFVFRKLTVERLALCVFLLTIIEVFVPPLFLIGCSSHEIAGVSSNYKNSTARSNYIIRDLNASCFSSCDCKSNYYQPVCSEGVTYFSPCLAGCPQKLDGNEYYSNCTCLGEDSLATDGKCDDNCTLQVIITALLFFIAVTLIFYNNIPFLKLTLRSVADKDRTVALGIQSFVLRIIGQLPGPLVVGEIFDLNCILWEETNCGNRGACLEYNSLTLKYSLIGVLSIGVCVSSFFFFLAWISWMLRKIPEKDKQYRNSS